jgi:hypothetical protein
MEILDNGIWVGEDAGKHHQFDEHLAGAIADMFKENDIKWIIDVGCGLGLYAQVIRDTWSYCDAVDGNPDTPTLTNGKGSILDISVPQQIHDYDGVLCLEVGEHLPKEKEQIFLNNITNIRAKIVVLSWAIPGQGGDGHLNEQPNFYVSDEMKKRGYSIDYAATNFLRMECTNCWWFKLSLMCFIRDE